MTVTTRTVTIRTDAFFGDAIAGLAITVMMDKPDIPVGGNSFALPKLTRVVTDEDGVATIELFPNRLPSDELPGLGSTGSVYQFTAAVPGGRKFEVFAQIPNVDCDLHSVVLADGEAVPQPGAIAGAVRYDIAQVLSGPQQAQARSNIAFAAAALALTLTGFTASGGGTVTSADSLLQALQKFEFRIADLEDGGISGPYTITANSSSPVLTLVQNGAGLALSTAGQITAGQFNGPLVGNVTGNAGTATTLATARAINGVSFNGSADITVTAAAGTLTGTTLAAGVTASSLTSVGTLTALTVSGATTLSGGTANGVAYLNGSKVLTTGTGLQFDGMNLGVGVSTPIHRLSVGGPTGNGISYNDGTVISYQGTTGSNKVLIGSLTNHPVDIISNIATVASFSSSGVAVTGIQTITANSASAALDVVQNGTGIGARFRPGTDQTLALVIDKAGSTASRFRAFVGNGSDGYAADEGYLWLNNAGLHVRTGVGGAIEALKITELGYFIPYLLTSAAGLPAGALWNDGGTVKVA